MGTEGVWAQPKRAAIAVCAGLSAASLLAASAALAQKAPPPQPGKDTYDVGIAKTGRTLGKVGEKFPFTLAVRNNGVEKVDGSMGVVVVDRLPANFAPPVTVTAGVGWQCQVSGLDVICRWVGGPIAAGQSFPPITVTATAKSPGSYENCADIGPRERDLKPRDNHGCAKGTIAAGEGGGTGEGGTHPPATQYDLGIDSSLGPTKPGSLLLAYNFWWPGGMPKVAPGDRFVIAGAITPVSVANLFTPWPATLPNGWTCTGDWKNFECSVVLPASYQSGAPIPVLELATTYPLSASGTAFNYYGAGSMTNNNDPLSGNNVRTVSATLP